MVLLAIFKFSDACTTKFLIFGGIALCTNAIPLFLMFLPSKVINEQCGDLSPGHFLELTSLGFVKYVLPAGDLGVAVWVS